MQLFQSKTFVKLEALEVSTGHVDVVYYFWVHADRPYVYADMEVTTVPWLMGPEKTSMENQQEKKTHDTHSLILQNQKVSDEAEDESSMCWSRLEYE